MPGSMLKGAAIANVPANDKDDEQHRHLQWPDAQFDLINKL